MRGRRWRRVKQGDKWIRRTHVVQINMMYGTEHPLLLCYYFLLFAFCAPFYHKVISEVCNSSDRSHTNTYLYTKAMEMCTEATTNMVLHIICYYYTAGCAQDMYAIYNKSLKECLREKALNGKMPLITDQLIGIMYMYHMDMGILIFTGS